MGVFPSVLDFKRERERERDKWAQINYLIPFLFKLNRKNIKNISEGHNSLFSLLRDQKHKETSLKGPPIQKSRGLD